MGRKRQRLGWVSSEDKPQPRQANIWKACISQRCSWGVKGPAHMDVPCWDPPRSIPTSAAALCSFHHHRTVLLPSPQHCAPSTTTALCSFHHHSTAPSIPLCLQTDYLRFGRKPPWQVSGIVAHTGARPRTPILSWAATGSPNPKQSPWEALISPSPRQDLHSKLIPSSSAHTQDESPVSDPHSTTSVHPQHPIPTTSTNTPYPVTRISMASMPSASQPHSQC